MRPGPASQAAALALAGILVGLAVNALRPAGLALARPILPASGAREGVACEAPHGTIEEVTVSDAVALRDRGVVFVDARPAGAYAEGHVAGALHLPSRGDAADGAQVVARLARAGTVVVYDADGGCALARHVASRLADSGVADVRVMLGGFPDWEAAGKPCQSGSCVACASGDPGDDP